MCGIVGYIGHHDPEPILIDGLKRVEYRGYDSCGVAILNGGDPLVARSPGRISGLESRIGGAFNVGASISCAIGHTRWATHGRPSEANSHPHSDCTGSFLVVHNGIIENHRELRDELRRAGHRFSSETDTEIIPHLIEDVFEGSLEEAVSRAVRRIDGMYGIAVVSPRDREKIVVSRCGLPLILGAGAGETFVASDPQAVLPYTRNLLFLDDRDVAVLRCGEIQVRDSEGRPVQRPLRHADPAATIADAGGYPNFMLKEIFEQPDAIRNTARQWIAGGAIDLGPACPAAERELAGVRRIRIVACGTSFHAALVGKFMLESIAGVSVETDYASEARYRDQPSPDADLLIAVTQSGETADTIGAVRRARGVVRRIISISNVPGSLAERESDGVLYTRAGPEVAVASTKAFTTQLLAFYVLALRIAGCRGRLSPEETARKLQSLDRLPVLMNRVLEQNTRIAETATAFSCLEHALFLGRGVSFPIALEGALKLKEISYIHAEGYPAGEMKHGPIALIDDAMPVVVVVPNDHVRSKTLSNVDEVLARSGSVVSVATEGDLAAAERAGATFYVPATEPLLSPLLTVLPLQLYAYHSAIMRGKDVDKPRNLAKSVTVE